MSAWWQVRSYIHHRLTARGAHKLHSPFVFDFYNRVIRGEQVPEAAQQIENSRREYLQDKRIIQVTDFGAGSRKMRSDVRRICDIARHALKPKPQGRFLYRLLDYTHAGRVLELGTSLGVTTAYLASGAEHVTTVEGSDAIHQQAVLLFQRLGMSHVQAVCSSFSDFLDTPEGRQHYNVVFIDGHHTHQATLDYYQRLMAMPEPPDIIVFDDIYWSAGMTKAWKEIQADRKTGITLDVFYFGIVFLKREQALEHFKLRWR
jgi:predicted O-methyltransferase YrrM